MHTTKVGWCGQAFALAPSNESVQKKTRIRRSKEERKEMVESFVKMYQKSNNGNFPSLNLTHKEVGGSFYTVREIVREIIQENRVLAPPKISPEEHEHSGFLDQHMSESISVEQPSMRDSDRIHLVAGVVPDRYQIMSEENIVSSRIQDHDSSTMKDEQIGSQVTENSNDIDSTQIGHHETSHYQEKSLHGISSAEQLLQSHFDEFKNHKVIPDGVIVTEGNQHLDMLEAALDKRDQHADYTIEVGRRAGDELADVEKHDSKDVEELKMVTSQIKSDVVVEKFPLRPVTGIDHSKDEESINLQEVVDRMGDSSIEYDIIMHEDSCLAEEVNGKYQHEEIVRHSQVSFHESAKTNSSSDLTVLDVPEQKHKVNGSSERLSSQDPNLGEREAIYQANNGLNTGSNSTMDRLNLDSWETSANKSTPPESNPFLAFVKALVTAFAKFWSE